MGSAGFSVLTRAISGQHQVAFTFGGERCAMCPHVLGWKDGRERVLGFVVRQELHPGIKGWCCFDVEELDDIRQNGRSWVTSREGMLDCFDRVELSARPTTGAMRRSRSESLTSASSAGRSGGGAPRRSALLQLVLASNFVSSPDVD